MNLEPCGGGTCQVEVWPVRPCSTHAHDYVASLAFLAGLAAGDE